MPSKKIGETVARRARTIHSMGAYSPEMPQLPLKGMTVQAQGRESHWILKVLKLLAPMVCLLFASSQVSLAPEIELKSAPVPLSSLARGQFTQEEISRLIRIDAGEAAPSYNESHKDNHPCKISIEQINTHPQTGGMSATPTRDPLSDMGPLHRS